MAVRHGLNGTLAALKIWPDKAKWIDAVKLMLPTIGVIIVLGLIGGWMTWIPQSGKPLSGVPENLLMIAGLAFIISLVAEIVARGFILSLCVRWSARWGAWASIAIFVLWHPLQAIFVAEERAAVYLAPSFLFATLILGIVFVHVRIKSGSLWPGIIMGWIAFTAWKTLLS